MNNFDLNNECNHHECDCKKVTVMEGSFSVYGFSEKVIIYEEYHSDEEVKENYFTHCKHDKTYDYDGLLTCSECGEIFNSILMNSYEDGEVSAYGNTPMNREKKVTAKEKQYNKKMQEMFPNLLFPEGNVMIKDIEKRFKHRKEPGDRFPTMKNLIHFILTKHEMIDLANTITISKSNKFKDLMEKLFKEIIPTSVDGKPTFEMFKFYLNKV